MSDYRWCPTIDRLLYEENIAGSGNFGQSEVVGTILRNGTERNGTE